MATLTVFPTPVGVFLSGLRAESRHLGLPHARGGVSFAREGMTDRFESSPRPWGCFFSTRKKDLVIDVFPTPVGVFLGAGPIALQAVRLPHARGGVSFVLDF